ncbi:hypothetical protein PMI06_003220 [Burkholderia sp. BT03]|nr:hypothetical protein PMI06_003220 [Burkholderia sp. BT03]
MSDRASALDLLEGEATNFGSTVLARRESEMRFEVLLRRADGKQVPYSIVARTRGSTVTAREFEPKRLPAFCPERHVNLDGTFCMYWAEHDAIELSDRASAIKWWNTLVAFLGLQERAANLRRWPDERGWAHGDAARFQHIANESAEQLGGFFQSAHSDKRLTAELCPDRPGRSRMLRLRLDGRHLYSVLLDPIRVANQKQPCLCAECSHRKRLRACRHHATAAARLAYALHLQETKEQEFWETFAGKSCCGQLDNCPLARL